MKTFKALFIDNGIIKAGEFPVEPEKLHDNEDYDAFLEHQEEIEIYRVAVNSAKANAVECEDQEEAAKVLAESEISGELFILPSGWDYDYETYTETVAKLCRTDEQKDEPDWEAISQLTPPETDEQPEPEESQEALWSEAEGIVAEAMGTYKTSLTVALASYARKELEKHFTITRRK